MADESFNIDEFLDTNVSMNDIEPDWAVNSQYCQSMDARISALEQEVQSLKFEK